MDEQTSRKVGRKADPPSAELIADVKRVYAEKQDVPVALLAHELGISRSKFYKCLKLEAAR